MFVLLGIGHFFVPFLALISRDDKKNWQRLRWVSVWVIFMEFVDVFWLMSPILGQGIHSRVAGAVLRRLLRLGGAPRARGAP